MSAPFLRPGRHIEHQELRRNFHYVDEPGAGFSFECDETGTPNQLDTDTKKASFRYCMESVAQGSIVDDGMVIEKWTSYEPPVIKCLRCQNEVTLWDAWLSTCSHCGADYNGSGQLLAPRHLWGEETGEHLADLITI
jgi:hypothetical protein